MRSATEASKTVGELTRVTAGVRMNEIPLGDP